MKIKQVDLSTFTRNSQFYGRLNLAATIKSFDLQAIRARYLESKKSKNGRQGSVQRRPVSLGGVAELSLEGGRIVNSTVLENLKEPRGLAAQTNRLAVSLENRVLVLDETGAYSFTNPWFSYIHTVAFHPTKPQTILITSSGFDSIFEFNYRNIQCHWEWFAWEHGLNEAHHPETGNKIILTRKVEEAKNLAKAGQSYLLVADPGKDHLPTAQRAAFINTAQYGASNEIIATLFHEGTVRQINQETGRSKVLLRGLKNPHGGQITPMGLLCTNTGGGQVWLNADEEITQYNFKGLGAKAIAMGEAEWLQNTLQHKNIFVTIDSNRNALVIFDPIKQLLDLVPFNENWALQDLAVITKTQLGFTQKLAALNNPTD
jgi:hypothetical protein